MKNYHKYLLWAVVLGMPALLYYGSYLPLKKSQALIEAMRSAPATNSLVNYRKAFLPALDFKSPVGEEETLKQFASVTFDVIAQKTVPKEIVEDLMKFVAAYVEPAIARGSGSGFVQYHYILGTLYQRVGFQYELPEYIEKAEKLYLDGLRISPTRPQFFYGLYDIYRFTNNPEKAEAIKQKLLSYWPRGLD